jgi:hypothetical protein
LHVCSRKEEEDPKLGGGKIVRKTSFAASLEKNGSRGEEEEGFPSNPVTSVSILSSHLSIGNKRRD